MVILDMLQQIQVYNDIPLVTLSIEKELSDLSMSDVWLDAISCFVSSQAINEAVSRALAQP